MNDTTASRREQFYDYVESSENCRVVGTTDDYVQTLLRAGGGLDIHSIEQKYNCQIGVTDEVINDDNSVELHATVSFDRNRNRQP